MKSQAQAYLYAGSAVLLWSTVASVFKLTLGFVDPVRMLFYASLVATLFLFGCLVVKRSVHALLAMSIRDWLRSAALGFLNPFAYYLVLFEAYDRLPAQEAQPLNYTWAVVLAVLSVPLLKQKIRPRAFVALGVSYLGVWIISTRGQVTSLSFADPLGVGLALGSTVIWALFWIANTRDERDPVLSLCANFLCGTLYMLPVVLLTDGFGVCARGLAGAAYAGVFEMGLTFVLWLKALKLSRTTAQVGNLIFLSPFLSLVLIHFVVGEDIFPSTLVGLGFILAGNAIGNLGRGRKENRGQPFSP